MSSPTHKSTRKVSHTNKATAAIDPVLYAKLPTSVQAVVEQRRSYLGPQDLTRLARLSPDARCSGLCMFYEGQSADRVLAFWLSDGSSPYPTTLTGKENVHAEGPARKPAVAVKKQRPALGALTNTPRAAAGAKEAAAAQHADPRPVAMLTRPPMTATAATAPAQRRSHRHRTTTPSCRGESHGTMISVSSTSEDEAEDASDGRRSPSGAEMPATRTNRTLHEGADVAVVAPAPEVPASSKSRSTTEAHVVLVPSLELQSLPPPCPSEDRFAPSPSLARGASPAVCPPPGARRIAAPEEDTIKCANGGRVIFTAPRARHQLDAKTLLERMMLSKVVAPAPAPAPAPVPVGAPLPRSPRPMPVTATRAGGPGSPRGPPPCRSHTGTPREMALMQTPAPAAPGSPQCSPRGSAWDAATRSYVTHPRRRARTAATAVAPQRLRIIAAPLSARGGTDGAETLTFQRSLTATSLGGAAKANCKFGRVQSSGEHLLLVEAEYVDERPVYSARGEPRKLVYNHHPAGYTALTPGLTSPKSASARKGAAEDTAEERHTVGHVVTPRGTQKRRKQTGKSGEGKPRKPLNSFLRHRAAAGPTPSVFERLSSNYYHAAAQGDVERKGQTSPLSLKDRLWCSQFSGSHDGCSPRGVDASPYMRTFSRHNTLTNRLEQQSRAGVAV